MLVFAWLNLCNVRKRVEAEEEILEEINAKKKAVPVFRTRKWEGRPPYELSCWGRMLVHPRTRDPTDRKGGVLFRTRFRVPFPVYERLEEMTTSNGWFRERPDCGPGSF